MIKKIFIIVLALSYIKTVHTMNDAQQLGKQFLKAQTAKDHTQFHTIMNNAIQKYRDNNELFHDFLDVRDGYGCTSLLRAAALRDMEDIIFILEKLEYYYGTHNNATTLDVFSFLNAQCLQGHTAFYLLAQNVTRENLDLMLYHIIRLIGHQKDLFLEFLNTAVYENKWTILHWLAYEGDIKVLELVVLAAEKVLGRNSEQFNSFINAEAEDGSTPLDSTYFNPRHRKFLQDHGAVSLHPVLPEINQARQLGLELSDAIRANQFNLVQKIILNAQKKYKNNPKLFLEFITSRTQAGWTPLMYAVALSYEYTAFLLHVIETYFENDEESFYTVLRSVGQDGRGALIVTLLRRYFDRTKLLIEKIKDYSPSKFFLYILLDIRVYVKGFTPLIAAVDFSSDREEFYDIIKLLVETVADAFGRDSRAVYLFVNTRENNGYPALSYATSPRIKKLLESYGATTERMLF